MPSEKEIQRDTQELKETKKVETRDNEESDGNVSTDNGKPGEFTFSFVMNKFDHCQESSQCVCSDATIYDQCSCFRRNIKET